MPWCGQAPWEPFPWMVIWKPSTEFIMVFLLLYIKVPTGLLPVVTWKASAASGFGFSKMPCSIMLSAPSKVSSAGWNINFTRPHKWDSFSFSILAALRSMAAWKSCPQACIFPVLHEKLSPLSSVRGSASISARSRRTGSPCPSKAVTPSPHLSGLRPYSVSRFITNSTVFSRCSPVSACSCR